MSTPNSIQELISHIEQAVEAYVARARGSAVEALERGFATRTAQARRPSAASRTKSKPRAAGVRRSSKELAELRGRLAELVRSKPGESMVTFSTELGVSVLALQRPMSQLKSEGQVRTVGQRHLTRYFPAVVDEASTSA